MTLEDNHKILLELTTQIVSAHVARNQVPSQNLPALIDQVYQSLRGVTVEMQAGGGDKQPPFVAAKRSVFPDYIVCLEDGRKLKTLKRHLRSTYNLSPEQYRKKWGLATDYPMVAPNYAEHRSQLAKQAGLGRKPASAEHDEEPEPAASPPVAKAEAADAEHAGDKPSHHTAASVFSRFPGKSSGNVEDDGDQDGDGAPKRGRKPFSKQLARGMRS